MRTAVLFAVGAMLLTNGCAYKIAASGTDLGTLETREQVQAKFGPPVVTGVTGGKAFEDFRTRRKVAESGHHVFAAELASGYSLGLLEVVLLPTECVGVAARTILGQDLRFVYDEDGQVTAVLRDGEYIVGDPQPRLGQPATTPRRSPRTPPAPAPDPPR
ncbi:MAG: hypothetical protein C0501_30795 [Isosphaera sp.]|nr:hypothetical protein [Isosphaera sp.]